PGCARSPPVRRRMRGRAGRSAWRQRGVHLLSVRRKRRGRGLLSYPSCSPQDRRENKVGVIPGKPRSARRICACTLSRSPSRLRVHLEANMPRREVKASADVFVGCSSQFLKLPWKPSPREIITKAFESRVLADGSTLHVNIWDDWSKRHAGFEIFGMLDLAAKT